MAIDYKRGIDRFVVKLEENGSVTQDRLFAGRSTKSLIP
jgi:hypothetical protein